MSRKTMYDAAAQSPTLRSPRDRRAEIEQVRDQLKQYKEFKEEHKFLTKRDRLMRTAWKHGVMGVDDADSKTTSIFYSDVRDANNSKQKDKDFINDRRQQGKSHFHSIF